MGEQGPRTKDQGLGHRREERADQLACEIDNAAAKERTHWTGGSWHHWPLRKYISCVANRKTN